MTHALFYLQQSIFEQDIIYRNEVFDNENIIINDCGFKKESEYISELKLMCKPHSWNSMMAFFGLASVLYRPVESLFPETNSKYMNQIYNRIILPRENKDNLPQCIIMWSSYSAEQFKISYQANHFVPVFKKIFPPLQNNFIDFTAFSDDKLSYIQDYLSIYTEDCNKPIIVDYNITKLVIDDDQNYNIDIVKDQEEYKKLVIEDQNYNVDIVKDQEYKKPVIEDQNYNIDIVKDRDEYEDHFNDKKRDQNSALLGLLMGIDDAFVPNVKNIDGCLIYEEAQDFRFNITRENALNKLFLFFVNNNQEVNYYWRPWQTSNYYLVELLKERSEFPPQISISIQKTYESNKILTKYCYCGGCEKNEKTTFKIIIDKLDLINSRELVTINVTFSINKKQCKHLDGKTYGQCRGLARQTLINSNYKSPRDMRKKIMSTVKGEVRYTGNRQHVPSAYSARTINSIKNYANKQLGYNLCERLHAAILNINKKEKSEYLEKNGSGSATKRQIWGFIQEPIQTQPLSIVIFNEAAIVYYYHYYVHENPGIFLDYTGQLVKPVPYFLTKGGSTDVHKRILNAFFTIPSLGKGSDAPPVDVFELITNDLSSNNLRHYLNIYRQKELQLFNVNSVPYLINTDCARNILVAVLKEYNNETPDQYFKRIIGNIVANQEFDNSKVLVAWCFGHAIRAIRYHIRSKKFIIEIGNNREILAKFAMRVWNSVRVKENIQDVENEIDKWEWLMLQKKLNLINEKVILVRKNRFNNFNNDNLYDLPELNFESNQNLEDENEDLIYISNLLQCNELNAWTYTMEDGNFLLKILQNHHSNYELLILQLDIKIEVQLDTTGKSIINPFYSVNLKNYLEKVWWKTIVLWSNLVPAIKNRTRRTTATVEVENNIVKNLDIGKKNLPIDEYIGIRTQTLKSTQNLIAEKLMRRSSNHKSQDQDKLNEQWKPKRTRVFTSKESKILEEFKIILDYRKTLDVPSQYRIAREIREISLDDIGFNQSMVSQLERKDKHENLD
ncbi:unnamed protein product [Rhizophagus irregularis]|nr:unnamed protein product [Rhizophagus irregularis]